MPTEDNTSNLQDDQFEDQTTVPAEDDTEETVTGEAVEGSNDLEESDDAE